MRKNKKKKFKKAHVAHVKNYKNKNDVFQVNKLPTSVGKKCQNLAITALKTNKKKRKCSVYIYWSG